MMRDEKSHGQGKFWSIAADARSINPEGEVLNVPGTPGEQAFARAQSLLREVFTEGAKLDEARIALYQATRAHAPGTPAMGAAMTWQPAHVPSAEEHDLAVASQKLYAKVMGNANATAERIKSVEKQLDSAVSDSLQLGFTRTAEGIGASALITKHVAGLSPEKRITFLAERVAANDKRTLSAVLAHPAYLSGLTDEEQATVREFAASRFDPLAFNQLRAVEKVRAKLGFAMQNFMDLYEKVQKGFDPNRVDAKRRAALIGGVA